MSNEVATQPNAQGLSFSVPAHLQAAQAAAGGGNIHEGVSINQLTFPGKVWKMTVNGETKVMTRVVDGEVENIQILRAVILDQGVRGRNYYANYDPENPRAPDCWSADGKRPHHSVDEPQHATCDGCPMAIKGSKIGDDGSEQVACKSFKYLALMLVKADGTIAYQLPPLRLKLAPTSIWDDNDKESQAQGWYAWDNFTKYLKANGVGYTNAMVVRMRFAPTNHPKIQFARGDFLELEDFNKTLELAKSNDVQDLINYNPPAGVGKPKQIGKPLPKDAEPHDERNPPPAGDPVFSQTGAAAEAAQAEEAKKAAEAKAKAADAKALKDAKAKADADAKAKADAEAKAAADAAAAKAAKIAEAKRLLAEAEAADAAPTAPSTPAASLDTPPPAKSTAKKEPPPAPAAAPAEVPAGLSSILDEWDA